MKWKWRKEAESEEQRMNESVMHREAEDEIITLFYYLLLLDCLHYYFSLYICSIGRYYTENMLSFTLNIMLTDSLLLTNTINRMLIILIANLLTLGIIRTVDIFTFYRLGIVFMPPSSTLYFLSKVFHNTLTLVIKP
jgi:hypothetical protein